MRIRESIISFRFTDKWESMDAYYWQEAQVLNEFYEKQNSGAPQPEYKVTEIERLQNEIHALHRQAKQLRSQIEMALNQHPTLFEKGE